MKNQKLKNLIFSSLGNYKVLVFIYLLCVSTICADAQLKFDKLTVSDGLSEGEVFSFVEDNNGFIWIGTNDGLNRYDGYEIQKIELVDEDNSLINSTVRALDTDSLNRLWIGTANGLCVYFSSANKIHRVNFDSYSELIVVRCFLKKDNKMYIGTNDGIWVTNIDDLIIGNSLKRVETVNFSLDKINVSSLLMDSYGNIVVGTLNGLYYCTINPKGELQLCKDVCLDNSIKNINSIVEDCYKNIWIGCEAGLYRFNYSTMHLDKIDNINGSVLSVKNDKKGNIWVGTKNNGIFCIEKTLLRNSIISSYNIKSNLSHPKGINSNLVSSIYITKDNILCVGTIGNGVNYCDLNQKKFNYYKIWADKVEDESISNFIRAVYVDDDKNIWIGTHNDGLYLINKNNKIQKKLGFDKLAIYYISEINESNKIVCTSNGAYILDKNNVAKRIIDNETPCFYAVRSSKNVFWLTGFIGIFRVELDFVKENYVKVLSVKNFPLKNQFGSNRNNCRVAQYNEKYNELWIGTEGYGLYRVHLDNFEYPDSIINYIPDKGLNSLSSQYIRSLLIYNDTTLWVGTHNGLNRMGINRKTGSVSFDTIFKEDGLPNNFVQSLLNDSSGNIWIGTNAGLAKLHTIENVISVFTESDGLAGNEFSEHAAFLANDGEMYWGGTDGVTSFYPNEVLPTKILPKITITGAYVNGKYIEPLSFLNNNRCKEERVLSEGNLELEYIENNISFTYSSMLYSSQDKVKYAFRMLGYNENWIYTDSYNRVASYTNLSPGRYEFQVKSTDSDGRWVDCISKVEILISAPLLLRWYFIMIYVFIVFLIVWYFIRYYILKKSMQREIQLEKEHNQKLKSLYEMRNNFLTNISHDLRTPLTLIQGPLEHYVNKDYENGCDINRQLLIAYKNVHKLSDLMNQLLDVKKYEIEKQTLSFDVVKLNNWLIEEVSHFETAIETKGLQLKYSLQELQGDILIDKDKLSKIIFNLISNAVKFTSVGYIEIKTKVDNNILTIIVSDTGIGIEDDKLSLIFDRFYTSFSKKGYGIGLSHIKEMVEFMGGSIKVTSQVNKGSSFYVSLPFQYDSNITNYDEQDDEVKDKKRILLVEDNEDMRDYIRMCLSNNFYVIGSPSVDLALELLKNEAFDLIITDIMMPGIDGLQFCAMVKNDIKTSHIPIIILTAKGDYETKMEGYKNLADAYMTKPFKDEELRLRIDTILKHMDNVRLAFQRELYLNPKDLDIQSSDKDFLTKLMEVIENEIENESFSIDDLERKMNMSHSSLFRKVKAITGMSAKELLQDVRLKRACQLLKETNLTITEVAFKAGFSNIAYFCMVFRKKYGVSPNNYRKNVND